MTYNILVDRLKEFYPLDHIAAILGKDSIPKDLTWEHGPLDVYHDTMAIERDDPAYHQGRIQHFANHGIPDPIEIDNYCGRNYVYPDPEILDGHHRFAAAVIRGDRTIIAYYGGRTDLLEWLTGDSDVLPED